MAFQSWPSSGNPGGVLGFKNWLKHTLAMIVQAAKAYLETEHETTFRFNPQTFIDKMSKSTDVYSPIEQVLLQVWKCSVSVVLHSSSSNLLFHELYLRREKTQRTLREELRKHNPDSNRAEQSTCPDRKLWLHAAPIRSFFFSGSEPIFQEEIHFITAMWLSLNKLDS